MYVRAYRPMYIGSGMDGISQAEITQKASHASLLPVVTIMTVLRIVSWWWKDSRLWSSAVMLFEQAGKRFPTSNVFEIGWYSNNSVFLEDPACRHRPLSPWLPCSSLCDNARASCSINYKHLRMTLACTSTGNQPVHLVLWIVQRQHISYQHCLPAGTQTGENLIRSVLC